jgi:hypothetical protein
LKADGYRLKPGEFPPPGSEHRIAGELVEADFIHRAGQFRTEGTGELVNFKLPPFGSVSYLGAEAELRDVPLGTRMQFFLYQDERGAFTQLATARDEFTQLAAAGLSYRLDKLLLDQQKLEVTTQNLSRTQPDLGHAELRVNKSTRVWKKDKQIAFSELAVGDDLLVNFTGAAPQYERLCSDIWVGTDSQRLATQQERKRHQEFLKLRGLPAWIDAVDGKKITVTLLGQSADMQALFKEEGIEPRQFATEHRYLDVVVANDELRTYNPPVDRERSRIVEFQSAPAEGFGATGVRWVLEPELLLEGFRKGRIVRLFVQQAWPVNDMPFGEGLYTESPNVLAGLEEAYHYPYRTDFANEQMPWYQFKPGEFPPLQSQHVVSGELLKVDAEHRAGQFRIDRSDKLVSFTLPPFGSITYLNAPAALGDLPLGTRYHFFLYQDDHGDFTRAAVIMDEFSRLLANNLSYRIEALKLGDGHLILANQLALVRNEKDAMVRPPDVGRGEFAVDEKTHSWKLGKQISLGELAVGDELLVNETGRTLASRGRCTDVWIGEKSFQRATTQQKEKNHELVKQRGFIGWIGHIDGKELTIAFFTGPGEEFNTLLHDGPVGGKMQVALVDENLISADPAGSEMKFKSSNYGDVRTGTYGSRGTSWVVEVDKLPKDLHVGQAVRVFGPQWQLVK